MATLSVIVIKHIESQEHVQGIPIYRLCTLYWHINSSFFFSNTMFSWARISWQESVRLLISCVAFANSHTHFVYHWIKPWSKDNKHRTIYSTWQGHEENGSINVFRHHSSCEVAVLYFLGWNYFRNNMLLIKYCHKRRLNPDRKSVV